MRAHRIGLGIGTVLFSSTLMSAQTTTAPPPATTTQQSSPGQQQSAPAEESKLTFDGEIALWTVAVRPDKTADFERVMTRVRDALRASSDPQRQRQAAGWKVVRLSMPLPDGNIGYVHVVHPVVAGADYTVMQILYDAFPDERLMLYELYRGAFAKNVGLATGTIALDMGPQAAPPPAASTPATTPGAPVPAPSTPAPPAGSAPPAPPAGSEPPAPAGSTGP